MNNWYIILNQRDGPYRSEDLMGEMKEREKEREPWYSKWKSEEMSGNGSEKCISMGALLIYEESLLGEH